MIKEQKEIQKRPKSENPINLFASGLTERIYKIKFWIRIQEKQLGLTETIYEVTLERNSFQVLPTANK